MTFSDEDLAIIETIANTFISAGPYEIAVSAHCPDESVFCSPARWQYLDHISGVNVLSLIGTIRGLKARLKRIEERAEALKEAQLEEDQHIETEMELLRQIIERQQAEIVALRQELLREARRCNGDDR